MKFSELPLESVFEFDRTGLGPGSSVAHGPWVKVSTRRYRHVDDVDGKYIHTVGTVRARVVRFNPRRKRAQVAATLLKGRRRRNPTRGRSRAPSIQKKYNTTVNALHIEFFQGYAEEVRYLRGADGKPYSHVVETDSAELYLAEHSTYGRCILIVDPSGKTPLWG